MIRATLPLRRLIECLDGSRIPLNREQRSEMSGQIPYWGAGGILDHINQSIFNEELVLLGEDGAPFFTSGKDVAYVTSGPTWVNNHIHVLRPRNVNPSFLRHALNCVDYGRYITGSTRDKLTQDDMLAIEIPSPPLDDQRRIAEFLDAETVKMDAIIAARAAQARCLSQLWEARLADVVSALSSEHGMLPLRRISDSIEQGWSPQCDDAIVDPDEWAVLKTSAVSSGRFDPLQHKRLPSSLDANTRYQVVDGDILMTRGSGSPRHVGVAAIAKTNGRKLLLSDLLYRVRVHDDWSPDFTVWMLLSQPVRDAMSLLFRGQSGQTIKLRADDIRSIEIPAVPALQQVGIAKRLDSDYEDIQAAFAGITASSKLLGERRQALIAAAVTGQIDVTTARELSETDGVKV